MSNENLSAREYAQKYTNARSAKARTTVREAVAAKAAVSKRKRWASLLAAIDAGDNARIQAHAATGEAKRSAWANVRADAQPAKPAAKPKARKAPAKPKAQPKAQAQASEPALDPQALVDELAKLDDKAFAAFFNAVAKARK